MEFREKAHKIINDVCRLFLFLMVVIVTIIVVGRFIFSVTPSWGEEMALLCMTWFGFLSISLAENKDEHIRIQIIDMLKLGKGKKLLEIFYWLIKMAFSLILIVEGAKFVMLNHDSYMSGIHLSMSWLYLATPVSGLCILYFLILKVKKVFYNG